MTEAMSHSLLCCQMLSVNWFLFFPIPGNTATIYTVGDQARNPGFHLVPSRRHYLPRKALHQLHWPSSSSLFAERPASAAAVQTNLFRVSRNRSRAAVGLHAMVRISLPAGL